MADLEQVIVVAELTTNHFGDRRRLRRMVELAALAGADMIKVQKRSVDSFYSPEKLSEPYRSPFGSTFGDYRRALELTDDDFDFLDRICADIGVQWFASALDVQSFQYFADRGHSLIKLPSTVTHHDDLMQEASTSCIDVVISSGMADRDLIDELLKQFHLASKIYLLQCTSAYPTPSEDCHAAVVRSYWHLSQTNPQIVPGYSSHDHGSFASCLAVAAGARMVEKHVKLGTTPWAHFDNVAIDLETEDFRRFVSDIRTASQICGSEVKRVLPSEHHKYERRVVGSRQ